MLYIAYRVLTYRDGMCQLYATFSFLIIIVFPVTLTLMRPFAIRSNVFLPPLSVYVMFANITSTQTVTDLDTLYLCIVDNARSQIVLFTSLTAPKRPIDMGSI